jgi:YVTN family beta-propeller protein
MVLALLTAPGVGAAPFAYISNLSSNTVTVIDGTTVLSPPAGLAVGAQPSGVAVNPAGTRVYVANSNVFDTGMPSVSVIDTASLAVVATITTGITGQPSGVAVSADGSLVYVANSNGAVAVIDAAANTVVNTLSPPPGELRQLAGIVVAGGSVYATDNFAGEVINVTDDAMPRLFVSFNMMGIAANASGSRLYVSYGDASDGNLKIAIIDVATSFAQQSFTSVLISTPGMDSGFDPAGVAVSPSGAFVYAPVLNEDFLAVINTANNSVTPIPVGLAPFGVAVDPMGTRVYVGNSGSRNATVFDATTNTVIQPPVALGSNPMAFGSFVASARPAPPPPQFTLTLATIGSGSITAQPGSATGRYDAGTVVALTATPDPGFRFTSWSGACSGSGACSVTMDAATSVTATFTAQYVLALTTIGSGSIVAQPAPMAGKYDAGTVVTLTATPASGSQFSGWSGACSGSNATCSVAMDATKSVTATFIVPPPPPAQFTLTLNTVGNGTIAAQPAPLSEAANAVRRVQSAPVVGKYNAGIIVTLTPMPTAGSQFSGWSGACSGSNATCHVTMNAARSVTATFTVVPPPPTRCDGKISDLRKKVAAFKHPWWHDHQLKQALKMYSESLVELGRAKAKVGAGDKRFVHAQKEFDAGKAALCSGHYWRAHHEFWATYVIAHEILKQNRR